MIVRVRVRAGIMIVRARVRAGLMIVKRNLIKKTE